MSSDSDSSRNSSIDIDELSQIWVRCRELRKEKDLLNASQSQSFQLIKGLELHVKTLLEAQKKDKKHIQELERELSNCSQEIDYLQDQLNSRNAEVHGLGDHVHVLELKLAYLENMEGTVGSLTEELKKSNSECMYLNRELQNKEMELQKSNLCIESLEESILSVSLEYQCEIEGMKLDLMAFEQSSFQANQIQEEAAQEKGKLDQLIQDVEVQIQDNKKVIESLDEENKALREKLELSENNARAFCRMIEETFPEWLDENGQSSSSELEKDTRIFGKILGPLLSRLVMGRASNAKLEDNTEKISCHIHEHEALIRQLKEELREQKLKANEEAEDLAQEMAELRYQLSGLLEEECKRRAYIEQISLQRITELEAQIEREQKDSFSSGSICLKLND